MKLNRPSDRSADVTKKRCRSRRRNTSRVINRAEPVWAIARGGDILPV